MTYSITYLANMNFPFHYQKYTMYMWLFSVLIFVFLIIISKCVWIVIMINGWTVFMFSKKLIPPFSFFFVRRHRMRRTLGRTPSPIMEGRQTMGRNNPSSYFWSHYWRSIVRCYETSQKLQQAYGWYALIELSLTIRF